MCNCIMKNVIYCLCGLLEFRVILVQYNVIKLHNFENQ